MGEHTPPCLIYDDPRPIRAIWYPDENAGGYSTDKGWGAERIVAYKEHGQGDWVPYYAVYNAEGEITAPCSGEPCHRRLRPIPQARGGCGVRSFYGSALGAVALMAMSASMVTPDGSGTSNRDREAETKRRRAKASPPPPIPVEGNRPGETNRQYAARMRAEAAPHPDPSQVGMEPQSGGMNPKNIARASTRSGE